MKRDIRSSALHPLPTPLLSILMTPSFAHGFPHKPFEPVGQHRPENEERTEQEAQRHECTPRAGASKQPIEETQEHKSDEQTHHDPNKKFHGPPQEGNLRLWG